MNDRNIIIDITKVGKICRAKIIFTKGAEIVETIAERPMSLYWLSDYIQSLKVQPQASPIHVAIEEVDEYLQYPFSLESVTKILDALDVSYDVYSKVSTDTVRSQAMREMKGETWEWF